MFNSTITKKARTGFAVALLMIVGSTAQADTLPTTEIMTAIEQNISAQTQEMLATAKREFMLSVQTQLAESMFEFDVVENSQVQGSREQLAKIEE